MRLIINVIEIEQLSSVNFFLIRFTRAALLPDDLEMLLEEENLSVRCSSASAAHCQFVDQRFYI